MPEQLRQHLNVRFFSSLLLAAAFLVGVLAPQGVRAQQDDASPDAREQLQRLRQERIQRMRERGAPSELIKRLRLQLEIGALRYEQNAHLRMQRRNADAAPVSSDLSDYETLDPVQTFIFGQNANPQYNFFFATTPRRAGDVNGDGADDYLYSAIARDERTPDVLEDRVGKTVFYFGGSATLPEEEDQFLYHRLLPSGDLNDDGFADAIEIDDGTVRIFTGSPSGYQDGGTTSFTVEHNFAVGFVDFDGDGYSDVLLTGDSQLEVIYGAADPADFALRTYDLSVQERSLYDAADLDGDGQGEVVRVGEASGSLSLEIFRVDAANRDLSTLQQFEAEELEGYLIYHNPWLVDIDGDGVREIAVSGRPYAPMYAFASLDGNGVPYDETPITLSEGGVWSHPVGDLDGDGRHDFSDGFGVAFGPEDLSEGLNFDEWFGSGCISRNGLSFEGALGDLTGDGLDDFIFGSCEDGGDGRMLLTGSSDRNLDVSSLLNFPIGRFYDLVYATANLGDVNGDGVDDLAMHRRKGDHEVIEVFLGGGSLGPEPNFALETPFAFEALTSGDFNGDGFSDIAVAGAFETMIFLGGETISNDPDHIIDTYDLTGTGVYATQNVGDINNDGIDDLLALTSGSEDEPDQALIFFGGSPLPDAPDVVISYEGGGFGWGRTVAALGDFNGDGVDDFAVERFTDTESGVSGAAHVYFGGANSSFEEPDLILTPDTQADFFFAHLAGGDFNGDGYGDVAIKGDNALESEGSLSIHVFYGGPDADDEADRLLNIPADALGPQAVDDNNDGLADALYGDLVAIPTTESDAGESLLLTTEGVLGTNALLYEGGSNLSSDPTTILTATNLDAGLGHDIFFGPKTTAAGDFNGDGEVDVVLPQIYDNNDAYASSRVYRYVLEGGAPSAPTITSIDPPSPVTGSWDPQQFIIIGSGFEDGATVTLRDLENDVDYPNREIESLTSIEIVINPIFGTEPATWSVEVINPDGANSGPYEFEVVAPSMPVATSFAHPVGGGGVVLPERITPETNNLYPDNPAADPTRGSSDVGMYWRNEQDVGSYLPVLGGIHVGEDWNFRSGTSDVGKPVYATANGRVLDVRIVSSSGPAAGGYAVIIEHVVPSGETYYSLYLHVVDASSTEGQIVEPSVSGNVEKGQLIARVGALEGGEDGYPPHLHFEIRDENWEYEPGIPLYPQGNPNGYYSHDGGVHKNGMSAEQVEVAYALMREDGFLDASDFIDNHSDDTSPPPGEGCPAVPGDDPPPAVISDCIDVLAEEYKVPGLIIRALLQQENSTWTASESSPDGGIGLTQITIPDDRRSEDGEYGYLPLADIEPGQQGRNPFTTVVDPNGQASLERLEDDWVYNLTKGISHLLAKKAGEATPLDGGETGVGTGEPGSDNRILENWYNALAYYNGFSKYYPSDGIGYCPQDDTPVGSKCGNDPGFPYYTRAAEVPSDWTYKKYFPYQECVFNTVAQQYTIPDRIQKGFPDGAIKVTLPGPAAVGEIEAGNYSYAWANYTGSKYLDFYVDSDGYGQVRKSTSCDNNTFDELDSCTWSASRRVTVHRVNNFSDHSAIAEGAPRGNVAVTAGQTGTVALDESGATVQITSNEDSDGGQLQFARYDATPLNNTFGGSATASDGSTVTPDRAAARYWDVTAVDLTDITYKIRLDITEIVGGGNPDQLLVLKRESPSAPWTPLNTTREGDALVSSTLTSFSQFTVGWALQPATLPVSISQSFGDPTDDRSYRLVALPGDASVSVASTLEGEAGEDWRVFFDNGEAEDYLVEHDGSARFTFAPGRGFWMLSESTWSHGGETETVTLNEDGTYAIALHEGWNIISNPFGTDLDWPAVQEANGGLTQALWQWNGSYDEAEHFASAQSGEAYYFFNEAGLDALTLPYPQAVPPGEEALPAQRALGAPLPTLTLRAAAAGDTLASRVRIGLAPEARAGLDDYDQFAPPGHFAPVRLSLKAPEGDLAAYPLAAEYRRAGQGQAFDLVLRAEPGAPVMLTAEGLEAFAGQEVVLVGRRTARRYDLRRQPALRVRPETETTRYALLIGSAAFVERAAAEIIPEQTKLLGNYPNPFVGRTTIAYTMAEPAEVRLAVYDVLGRRVAVLVDERQEAGRKEIPFEARGLASGLYVYRLRVGDYVETGKLVLVR